MPCYQRVTYENRCQIQAYLNTKISISEIARRLGFHKSTISREIKRNKLKDKYDSKIAHKNAKLSFSKCRRKFLIRGDLEEIIQRKIAEGWGPLQLSGRLLEESKIKLSHETIYKYIRAKKCLREDFYRGLRRYKKKGIGRYKKRKLSREWMLRIKERPEVINKRERIGDWERDTMYVKDRKRILVCIERKSRFIKIEKIKEPFSLYLNDQTKNLLEQTHKSILTITNDNGSEFMDAFSFKIPIYYCDPYKPQQRGSVENVIGSLRQYIKRTDEFSSISPEDLQKIEDRLNLRPRKVLGFKTPYEVLYNKRVALVS
jgi:IS30 family transposase